MCVIWFILMSDIHMIMADSYPPPNRDRYKPVPAGSATPAPTTAPSLKPTLSGIKIGTNKVKVLDEWAFEIHYKEVTWYEAREACKSQFKGSKLAIVQDERTYQFLKDSFPSRNFWLGASTGKENWIWRSSEKTTITVDGFNKWALNQGRADYEEQRCLFQKEKEALWYAYNCSRAAKFICQHSWKGKMFSVDDSSWVSQNSFWSFKAAINSHVSFV